MWRAHRKSANRTPSLLIICSAFTYLPANNCRGAIHKANLEDSEADDTHINPGLACGWARGVDVLSFDRRWASPVRPNVSRSRRHASKTKAPSQTNLEEWLPARHPLTRRARARTLTPTLTRPHSLHPLLHQLDPWWRQQQRHTGGWGTGDEEQSSPPLTGGKKNHQKR